MDKSYSKHGVIRPAAPCGAKGTRNGARVRASIKFTLVAGVASFATLAYAEPKSFDIAAQPLDRAIAEFSRQSGQVVSASAAILRGKKAAPVHGTLEPSDALAILISGTGLKVTPASNGALLITRSQMPGEPVASGDSGVSLGEDNISATDTVDIVVTAQKRSERLRDVPVPVTAITSGALVNSNQLRLQDYYERVPGLNLTVDNRGAPVLSVRGLTTGAYANPTVSVTVDDVPFGASTYSAYSWAAVDVDPDELERVEVLRGPQGTLYGASSLGGLVKYVTVAPALGELSGRARAGLSTVSHSSSLGYTASGAVNLPLGDVVAIRASANTRREPGFIDNVLTGQDDVNELNVWSGKVAALFEPSNRLSLTLTALYQRSKLDGSPFVDVPDGSGVVPASLRGFEQYDVRDVGGFDRKLQAYSTNMRARLGSVNFTSVTGYNINKYSDSFDLTYLFGAITQPIYQVDGVKWSESNRTRKFSQEVRFDGSIGARIDWLVGGFFTDERTHRDGGWRAVDSQTGTEAGRWLIQIADVKYREYAFFGDLTLKLNDRFDVQLGARQSYNKEVFEQTVSGPYVTALLGQPSPNTTTASTSADAFTYLITPRFKVSPDLMVYARFASGYRPGGPNPGVATNLGFPASYKPDTTNNYEIGLKGRFLEGALSVDASVYYIDWKDIQLTLVDATFANYLANVSSATSKGVELSVEARPTRSTTLSGWLSVGNAKLTSAVPAGTTIYGSPGDRLPYSTRFSGSLDLTQRFPVSASATGFVNAGVSYVGNRDGEFASIYGPNVRERFPGYAKVTMRVGADFQRWSVNVVADNLFNSKGELSGGVGYYPPFSFQYIRPRSLSLSASTKF